MLQITKYHVSVDAGYHSVLLFAEEASDLKGVNNLSFTLDYSTYWRGYQPR